MTNPETVPPVVLGVECEWRDDGQIGGWFVEFGALTVTIYPPTSGLWGRRVWQWRVGGAGNSSDVKDGAIEQIEKELLGIKAEIPPDPAIDVARRAKFDKSLEEVRQSMRIVSRNGVDLCVFGCERMVKEGPRSYLEKSPEVGVKCSSCGLPRWHRGDSL